LDRKNKYFHRDKNPLATIQNSSPHDVQLEHLHHQIALAVDISTGAFTREPLFDDNQSG
jgi:hypothetical protein